MSTSANVTRRDFIKASAVTAGAMAMAARSYAQVAGANDRLNLGVIGCGGISNHHLDKMLKIYEDDNFRYLAVCDVYKKRAEKYQRKIKREMDAPALHENYKAVLDNKDIDYVLIATPEHAHHHITMDALAAGKHVYVEKPLTHTLPEALEVVAKVKETGLKLQVGVQGTADDSYASAFTAIKEGKLGSIVQAQIDYVRNYTEDGPWRKGGSGNTDKPADLNWEAWQGPAPRHDWDPHRYYEWRCYSDYSGGIATDLFIHRLTRLIKACGLEFPDRVVGMGGIYTWDDGRDLPDSMELLAEYPAKEGITNGMTVHVLGTMANEQKNPHCIRGTEATLFFEGEGWVIKNDANEVIETHKKTGGEDVDPHHRNHHAAIRDASVELNCPAEIGLYGVVACRMANLSWFKRRMMHWDADKQEII